MQLDTLFKNLSVEKKMEKYVRFADYSICIELHMEGFVKNDKSQQ